MTFDPASTRRASHLAFRTALLFGALLLLQAPLLYAYAYYESSLQAAGDAARSQERLVRFLDEQKRARAMLMKSFVCADDAGALCWPSASETKSGDEPGGWLALDASLKPCAPAAGEAPRDRELEAEWRNILTELRNRPLAADAVRELALRQYWTRYGAEPRLVTIAPLAGCAGQPAPGGLLVHSEAISALFSSAAARAADLSPVRLSTDAPAPAAGPGHELAGFRPGERFYLSPAAPEAAPAAASALPALRAPPLVLSAWAALQILITAIVFYVFGRRLLTLPENTDQAPGRAAQGALEREPAGRIAPGSVSQTPVAPLRPGPAPLAAELLRTLQDRALDGALVPVEGFEISGALLPADPPGGDLYFQTRTDDACTALLFADASGRGAAATLVALHAALLFQKHARSAKRAGDILEGMNRDFTAVFQASEFLACAVCRLNPQTLQAEYASAGATDAFYFPATGVDPVRFNSDEPPLGANAAARYSTLNHALKPGDRVALVSDGALLQSNPGGESYGPVRFERWMHAARAQKNSELAANWLKEVERFRGAAKLQDDLAILCIEANTPTASDAPAGARVPGGQAATENIAHAKDDSLEGLLARARAAYGAARYADAVRDYQQVLARDPGHDASRFNLALAHFRNGETDAARRALEPYLARYPDSERARTLERALASAAPDL